jgi:hypothetical protein
MHLEETKRAPYDPADSPSKMSLRPRKVNNYQQMLEGDEATLQTIRDEQQEKRRVESGQPGREAMQED